MVNRERAHFVHPDTGEILDHKGRRLTPDGREIPDPRPIAPPVGYKKQPSMFEHMRSLIRSEQLAREAAAAGFDTFEESDDFDVGDDYDPTSPYENEFEPPLSALLGADESAEGAEPEPKAPLAKPNKKAPKKPKEAPEAQDQDQDED